MKVAAAAGADPVLLGDTTLETFGDSNGAGQAQAWPYTATITGTATDIEVYVNTGNAATRIGVGLYSNASGHPSSRLTYASITTIHAGAWNDITVPSVNVTAGTQYWLAILGTGGAAAFRDKAAGTCATSGSQTNQTSMPATWSQAWQVTGYCPGSIYLNGTVPAPIAPANTTLPAISGTAQQGQTLTATQGSWSGTTPITYAYQWQDCAAGTCQNITGATSSTYTPVANDVGSTLDVVVTATNTAGSGHATSAVTQTVQPAASAPANTTAPSISGTPTQGQTLTASNGSWNGSPTGYAYQWQDCDSTGANCSNIAGATSGSYTLAASDVGHTVDVIVTATNAAGSTQATSKTVGPVAASPPPPPPSGTLVGDQTVEPTSDSNGAQVQAWQYTAAASGTASTISGYVDTGSGPVSLGLYSDNGGQPGTLLDSATISSPISGAWNKATLNGGVQVTAGTSYWLAWVSPSSDGFRDNASGACKYALSSATSLSASFNADGASGTGYCPASIHVDGTQAALAAPQNTKPPSITGTTSQGSTLTADKGAWTGNPAPSYGYQWQDCGASSCTDIQGATSSSYTLAASDVGQSVDVTVKGSNSQGSASASSSQVGPVTTPPPPPPPGSGFTVQGSKILAPDGTTFLPVGANLDGQDIWWNLATTGTVAAAQDWGWNTVRLNSCLPGGCSSTVDGCGASCDYLPAPALDNEISEYTAQHIVVMPELHDMTSGGTASMTAIINWWTALANKYKNNPYVWFNPLNEPLGINAGNPQQDFTDYKNLYGPIVSAIRNTGAQNIIVLDGAASGQDSYDWSCSNSNYMTYSDNINVAPQLEAQYGNIVTSVHVYNEWGGGNNVGCSQQSLEAAFVGYMQAVHNAGVPLVVGEAGDNPGCNGSTVGQMPGQCEAMLVAEDCSMKYGVGFLWWHGDLGTPPTNNGDFTNINSPTNPTNLSTANMPGWDQGWGGGKALWDLAHGGYSPTRCTS